MAASSEIRRNITLVCNFIAMSERGERAEATELLESVSIEELRGAFLALAGGYSGLASMLGLDLRNMDDEGVVEQFVGQAEWVMQVLKGRMGYN